LLIFNGHVDVVSAEPLGHWSHNPWGGDIVTGRMYGRGAADMKSGVAAMIYALKAVHEAEVKLCGDVLIESVIDEECTGNGTLSCLAQGYRADAAVVHPLWYTSRVLTNDEHYNCIAHRYAGGASS
jgi:acetylornithine deacetylase